VQSACFPGDSDHRTGKVRVGGVLLATVKYHVKLARLTDGTVGRHVCPTGRRHAVAIRVGDEFTLIKFDEVIVTQRPCVYWI
jgi:hypothetical protein